jgi:hypothetical protein
MAVKKGIDQGKTTFLTETLSRDPAATEPDIVEAWKAAGHEGTISGSLIYKVRTRLGLSGKGKSSKGPAVRGRPKGSGAALRGRVHAGPGRPPRAETKNRRLDELEGEIDDLMFKLKGLGDMADVEEALRSARRALVRRHEG